MPPTPRVLDGILLVYRLFDVADEIHLDRAEALLEGAGERLKLAGERQGFLELRDRPLAVGLGARELALDGGVRVASEAHVRLFAHGVASVRHEIPLPAGADAAAIADLVRLVADSGPLERAARTEARAISERLRPAFDGPHESAPFETYTVVFAHRLEGVAGAAAIAGRELAATLLGEPPAAALSDQTVANVTRHRFSYTDADLCVLDWDAAFVLDPSGDRSVADVLEVATAQLLEFRYYDALFERELLAVTDGLKRRRHELVWLRFGRTRRLSRRLQRLVVESAEFVERVENAVPVVGDLYLARIYRAAVERFRIPAWQGSVLRRQRAALDVATLLRDEASTSLALLLEGSILALIVLELVLALVRGRV